MHMLGRINCIGISNILSIRRNKKHHDNKVKCIGLEYDSNAKLTEECHVNIHPAKFQTI